MENIHLFVKRLGGGKVCAKCGQTLRLVREKAMSELPWPKWEHVCLGCIEAQSKDVHQPPLVLVTGTVVKRPSIATA